jgi:hypothetical protein
MQAIIEVAASRVAVYPHGYSEPIWVADLSTQNGRRDARKLAAQLLIDQPTTLCFVRDGKSYRVPVSKGLAARIAEVSE